MPVFDAYEHIHMKLNPDGTVTRLLKLPTASDSDDHSGTVSKTFTLDHEKKTSVHLFFPSIIGTNSRATAGATINDSNKKSSRIPVVVYFHGNSWVRVGADNILVKLWCSNYATTMPAIMVLVDYRLAPENRLPAQYDDAIDALLWLKKQAFDPNGDRWLKDYGDFSRCYLHGDENGGNMAYHVALRAMDMDLGPIKLAGLIMNQPLFGGKQRTASEMRFATDQILPLPVTDLIWDLALPKGTDRDHRFCNPMIDGPHKAKLRSLQRCLVFGFGMNPLIDRQQDFVQMLAMHGVQVQAHFDEVGFHRIDIVDSKRAVAINDMIKEFINCQS